MLREWWKSLGFKLLYNDLDFKKIFLNFGYQNSILYVGNIKNIQNMRKKFLMALLAMVVFIGKYFSFYLPIVAISLLINALLFPSDTELLLILMGKSFLTTIPNVLVILYGTRKSNPPRTKFRHFCWVLIPTIPYLELIVIACYDLNLRLFLKKFATYIVAYSIWALYVTYGRELSSIRKRFIGKNFKNKVVWIRLLFLDLQKVAKSVCFLCFKFFQRS